MLLSTTDKGRKDGWRGLPPFEGVSMSLSLPTVADDQSRAAEQLSVSGARVVDEHRLRIAVSALLSEFPPASTTHRGVSADVLPGPLPDFGRGRPRRLRHADQFNRATITHHVRIPAWTR